MARLRVGSTAPEFSLARHDGVPFTQDDLRSGTTVLVFYPFAFSPVCVDQLAVYNEVLDEFTADGATLYAVSCDATWSQQAFKAQLNVNIEQLSDFEPKGRASEALGVLHPGGFCERALLIFGSDSVLQWSYVGDTPDDLPGVNLIFDALAA